MCDPTVVAAACPALVCSAHWNGGAFLLVNCISCCPATTKVLLVLLRIAIGWHLLYEGLHKLETFETAHPWSSRWYLQNSEGPAAGFFQRWAPEKPPVDSFDQASVSAYWSRVIKRHDSFYRYDEDQLETAHSERQFFGKQLRTEVFGDPLIQATISEQARLLGIESGQRTTSERNKLMSIRSRWLGILDSYTTKLEIQLQELLESDQRQLGIPPASRLVAWIDRLVVAGLVGLGGCLVVGLFGRPVAVAAAMLLLFFYVAMPPLPGLTGTLDGSSHYLIVNTILIEVIALLALATTSSGRWAGLDFLLHQVVRTCQGRHGDNDA